MASTEELEAQILAEMESNPEAYLVEPVNDILMIDPETRTINLPSSEALFGTYGECNVERKYFKCPKIVGDNIDLSKHRIYISYMSVKEKNITSIPDTTPDMYYCEDMAVDGDYITFSWKLSGNVLETPGFIGFAVVAKLVDGESLKTRWKTIPAVGTVLLTLPDGEAIEERYPDIISQLLNRMDEVEALATPEAMQNYVEAYLVEHPAELDETLTDNAKAAPAGMVGEMKEEISSLSEEIGNQSGGSGATIAQANSLWTLVQKMAFAEVLTDEDINTFKTTWGIIIKNIPATGITLNKVTISFTDSVSQTLIATVTPSNSTDTVTWESSNTSVASVKNGVVTPVANGSCTITAKAGSYSASCDVTVAVEGEIVTLSSISATYTGGDVVVGTALTDLTGITVTATYSDGSTANVTDYTLSGEIIEGENTITISYSGKTTIFIVTGVAESSGGEDTEGFVNLLTENNVTVTSTTADDVSAGIGSYAGNYKITDKEIQFSAGVTYYFYTLYKTSSGGPCLLWEKDDSGQYSNPEFTSTKVTKWATEAGGSNYHTVDINGTTYYTGANYFTPTKDCSLRLTTVVNANVSHPEYNYLFAKEYNPFLDSLE